MALQYSVLVRNAQLDAVESTAGVSAFLQLRTGAQPSDCSQAASGTLLAEIPLPADWMANAGSGVKAKSGTWSTTGAATGTAAHYRIVDNAKTTCHVQGSVTISGGGGDLTLDNPSIASGQSVVVNTYQLSAANA